MSATIEQDDLETLITAREARELYAEPPFTVAQIDEQIREKAKTEDYTGFDKKRLTEAMRARLRRLGFTVEEYAGMQYVIVRW